MILDNATLLEINEPGTPDINGDVTTAGDVAWAGTAPGYLTRIRSRQTEGDTSSLIETDQIILRAPTGLPFSAMTPGESIQGYTVLVSDGRVTPATERRYRITFVDRRAVGTIADSLRIGLDQENV